MNQTGSTPETQDLAQRLIAFESAHSGTHVNGTSPTYRVCEKMRHPLSTLAGNTGFKALLARAINVAKSDTSWLSEVEVKEDGTLGGLESIPREEATQAGVALTAQLLALLMTFIGEYLTLRMVREIWPDLPASQLEGSRTK